MKTKLLIGLLVVLCMPAMAQSLEKGSVTQIMNGGRILAWQELTPANLPFTKGQGAPFSIFLRPKDNSNTTESEVVQLRGFQEDNVKEVPLTVQNWNVVSAVYFPVQTVNTALFTNYRVFVGFGQEVK